MVNTDVVVANNPRGHFIQKVAFKRKGISSKGCWRGGSSKDRYSNDGKKEGAWIWRSHAFSDTYWTRVQYWSVIHLALMARVEMETVSLSEPALIGRRDPRNLTLSLLRDHRTSQLSPISHSKTLPYFHKRFETIFLSPITYYKKPSTPPFTSLLPP